MTDKIDHTIPSGRWDFNSEVTQVFDNMLERSIPQYDIMREASTNIIGHFIQNGDIVIDIGCSSGIALQTAFDKYGARCKYYGIEISDPMIEKARERFKLVKSLVKIEKMDLRFDFPNYQAGAIMSILTLMFIPMEYRQKVIRNCWLHLKRGGVLILVEKVLGETSELNTLYVEEYLAMKAKNGYSQEEIDRKRYALEGVLVPITAKWNEQLLASAGFRYVDKFWRWMNFSGWVAIR